MEMVQHRFYNATDREGQSLLINGKFKNVKLHSTEVTGHQIRFSGKKNFVLLLVLFKLVTGHGLAAQSVLLGEFNKLKTLGDVKVELISSTENKAEYYIERGFEKDLHFDVDDEQLTIQIKAPAHAKYNRLVTKAKVKLYYKELRDIQIGALSDVQSRDTLTSPFLRISGSKGSRGRFQVKSFTLNLSASNNALLFIHGKSETVKIEATSNSVIEGDHLVVKEAAIDAQQNAKVTIHCEKAVTGKSGSGAKIRYRGNPAYKNVEEAGGSFTAAGK